MLISLIPSLPFIPSIVSGTSLLAADGCWTSTLSWNSLSHSFVFFNWWYEYRWSFMRILAYGRKIYTICGKMQGKNLSLVHMWGFEKCLQGKEHVSCPHVRVWEMLARKRTCLSSTCEGLRKACKEKNMSLAHMWSLVFLASLLVLVLVVQGSSTSALASCHWFTLFPIHIPANFTIFLPISNTIFAHPPPHSFPIRWWSW